MHKLEVTWFESWLKDKGLVVLISWLIVITAWERDWLRELPLSFAGYWILQPQDLLKIAGSNELIEIVVIEFLIRIIVLLAISRVYDWVWWAIHKVSFVFKIKQVPQRCFAIREGFSYDFLNFRLFCIFCSTSSCQWLDRCLNLVSHILSWWVLSRSFSALLPRSPGVPWSRSLNRCVLLSDVGSRCHNDLWPLRASSLFDVVFDIHRKKTHVESCPYWLVVGVLLAQDLKWWRNVLLHIFHKSGIISFLHFVEEFL